MSDFQEEINLQIKELDAEIRHTITIWDMCSAGWQGVDFTQKTKVCLFAEAPQLSEEALLDHQNIFLTIMDLYDYILNYCRLYILISQNNKVYDFRIDITQIDNIGNWFDNINLFLCNYFNINNEIMNDGDYYKINYLLLDILALNKIFFIGCNINKIVELLTNN